MKRKSLKLLTAILALGVVTSACGRENGSSKDSEEDITIQELADQVMAEVPTESEKELEESVVEVLEPTAEEVEEGFTFPEPMPEILNASLDDCIVQYNDMIVDISFWELNNGALDEGHEAFMKAHRTGTFKELYEQIKSWGFIGEPSTDMLVLGHSSSYFKFLGDSYNSYIWIEYYNDSDEAKKLADCDAFCVVLASGYDPAIWNSPYIYLPGGICSEDSYWTYMTLIDYLKENEIEYTENGQGTRIQISVKLLDVVENYNRDGNSYDNLLIYFDIDAETTDLTGTAVTKSWL